MGCVDYVKKLFDHGNENGRMGNPMLIAFALHAKRPNFVDDI